MSKVFYIFSAVLIILVTACEKITTVNPVPVINFKDYTLKEGRDTFGNLVFEGKLVFSFSDDDGADLNNAGYGDTIYSIILTPYIKVDTIYSEADFDSVNNYLIYDSEMNINKVGQNKTLKGDIEITRHYFTIPADTVKFEFYIIDRDENISNTEVTPDIGFR